MPKISVIVPIYKVEKYINRCVDSILAQTFTDFELILVDDGSPDNCGQICEEYAKKDTRIHVIHQKNGGLSAARNAGIKWVFVNSDSEWLTFIDSDDWIHEFYLEALYQAVCEYGVKVAVCNFQETIGEALVVQKNKIHAINYATEKFYLEQTVNATIACGKLYYKECFTKIRYPNGRIHEDEYVIYRILFFYPEIAVIQAPLYAYYVNPEGITKSAWKPNRMDIFPAFEHQIAFFKKKGMKDLMELRIRNYLWSVELQMDEVNSRSNLPRQYDRRLRRRLGSILLRWRDLYPFEQNKKRYETAFPKGMWLYWTIEGLKYKILKRK